MILKYAGLAATAVLLTGCWTRRQVDVVSGGEVVATRADAETGGAIPAGASLAVRIDQDLSTEKSKVGDRVTATVSTSLLAQNGDVIVPQGARVYGQIAGLDDSDDPTDRALIQLRFEGIEFQGERYPLRATVIDVGDVVQRSASTGQVVQRAAAGAAAGAVIGAIVSGGELDAIIKGGGFGAAAGTIISLGLGDVEHVIPAGTPMVLRADNTVTTR
jgi:hypothetical protein